MNKKRIMRFLVALGVFASVISHGGAALAVSDMTSYDYEYEEINYYE